MGCMFKWLGTYNKNSISCPVHGNVSRKHAEKLAKCGDLRVEINYMWQCRTGSLGALGMVAGPHSRSPQPTALTKNSASEISLDPA